MNNSARNTRLAMAFTVGLGIAVSVAFLRLRSGYEYSSEPVRPSEPSAEPVSAERQHAPVPPAVLEPESLIAGTLVYADSGDPAAGYRVHASVDGESVAEGESSETGEFTITAVADRENEIDVDLPEGWILEGTHVFSPRAGETIQGRNTQLKIVRGNASIAGTVTNSNPVYTANSISLARRGKSADEIFESFETNAPAPNVRIDISGPSGDLSHSTDRTGRYYFSNLIPGQYQMRVYHPDFDDMPEDTCKRVITRKVNVAAMETKEESIALPLGLITARGRVVDSSGNPVANAQLEAKIIDSGSESTSRHDTCRRKAQTDANGQFELRGLQPPSFQESIGLVFGHGKRLGSHEIWARAEGYVDARTIVPAIAEPQLELIQAIGSLGYLPTSPIRETELHPDLAIAGLVVSGIEIVMMQPASIRGRLLNTAGQAIGHSNVVLRVSDDENVPAFARATRRYAVDTNRDGFFTFNDLPAGTLEFRARISDQHIPATTDLVAVAEGKQIDDAEIVVNLDRLRDIRGHVIDSETQKPVTEFSVGHYHLEKVADIPHVPGRVVNDNSDRGEFLISGISPGKVRVGVSAPGYAGSTQQILVSDAHGYSLDFLLEPEGVAIVRTVLSQAPIPVRSISLILNDAPLGTGIHSRAGGTITEDVYRVDRLEAGVYTVIGYREVTKYLEKNQWRITRIAAAEARVESGRETEVVLEFGGSASVTGMIDTDPLGQPAELFLFAGGIEDSAIVDDENFWRRSTARASLYATDTRIPYEIPGLPPGQYTLVARIKQSDENYIYESKTFQLGPGGSTQVDISFASN